VAQFDYVEQTATARRASGQGSIDKAWATYWNEAKTIWQLT
jgi:hypothetical protein